MTFSVLDTECCHSLFSMKKCPLTQKLLCLSSKIAPANVALPLKYLKQNLSRLPIPFYGHIEYTAK